MARRRKNKGPRLLIFRDDHLTVAPTPVDRLFIGRHRQAHIHIDNPDVNLKHAVIERVGVTEKFRLIDFGTTIPTLVNGEATGNCPIDYGTQIEIAEYIYFDRVRKDAPEEHRIAFDNLIEMEKKSKGSRFSSAPAVEFENEEGVKTEDLDAEDGDAADGDALDGDALDVKRRGRGRRRRRTGLKSSARRRRNAKGL